MATAPPDDFPDRWVLTFDVTTVNRRAVAAMATVGNGRWGTRVLGSLVETDAETVGSGVFDDAPVPDLLPAPVWAHLPIDIGEITSEIARLDLWNAIVERELCCDDGVLRATYFASARRTELHTLRLVGPNAALRDQMEILAPESRQEIDTWRDREPGRAPSTMAVSSPSGASIAASVDEVRETTESGSIVLTRYAGLAQSRRGAAEAARLATDALGQARTDSYEQHLEDHTNVWHERWRRAAIDLPEQPDLEQGLRFAQFHLLMSSHTDGEATIGARSVTGRAYRGHVFWDTDVFVVPALCAMAPELARAALLYRSNRLSTACDRATKEGRDGARFPWESASTGDEVTPPAGVGLDGVSIPILTGSHEEHIVADVAWACCHYDSWTGDETFRRGVTAPILVATARYWQSRVEIDDDGSGHIRMVIGPDEYHELIDDSAYTNVMARWNLLTAADVCDELRLCDKREWQAWRLTAERLVDGFDSATLIHEQFAGFHQLEPVLPHSFGEPPLAADALVGHQRIQQMQTIKQADVLMLHHLVPELMPAGSLDAEIDYYLPRTAHGSSLSPAISASVLARAGRLQEAARWLGIAANFDLTDLSGTTGAGVHLATMGGLWQAFNAGFMGVRPIGRGSDCGLALDPKPLPHWGPITHRLTFRGRAVRLALDGSNLAVHLSEPVPVVLPSGEVQRGASIDAIRTTAGWEFR